MKKVFILFFISAYCLSGIACQRDSSWVDSRDGRIMVKKVTLLDSKAVLVLADGKKTTLPHNQIITYSCNDKTYKRLPLYIDGKQTSQLVFMELVKNEGEMELYRYCNWSYNPNYKITSYLLFNGDKLIMEYDEKTHP